MKNSCGKLKTVGEGYSNTVTLWEYFRGVLSLADRSYLSCCLTTMLRKRS